MNEYEHLKTNNRLKLNPSKKDHLLNCGTTDNNNLIMKYINSLYDEYDIPNPLKPAPKEKRIEGSQLSSYLYEGKETPKKKGMCSSKIIG